MLQGRYQHVEHQGAWGCGCGAAVAGTRALGHRGGFLEHSCQSCWLTGRGYLCVCASPVLRKPISRASRLYPMAGWRQETLSIEMQVIVSTADAGLEVGIRLDWTGLDWRHHYLYYHWGSLWGQGPGGVVALARSGRAWARWRAAAAASLLRAAILGIMMQRRHCRSCASFLQEGADILRGNFSPALPGFQAWRVFHKVH